MTNGNISTLTDVKAVASEALAALDTGGQIAPFSARLSAFDLDDAYRVTAAIRQMREMRGEMLAGRKIGFTNRTVWAEYGPIWDMFTTARYTTSPRSAIRSRSWVSLSHE